MSRFRGWKRKRRRKKMYDAGKISPGIILFLAVFTFPLWSNMGQAVPPPNPELPKTETACVDPREVMKTSHMQLLNEWRDLVVRDGNRRWVGFNGREHMMSLQNNCMSCHSSKVKFCDQCHNYAGVTPYCWDCHIEPKENM
jgi:hypothetical protein